MTRTHKTRIIWLTSGVAAVALMGGIIFTQTATGADGSARGNPYEVNQEGLTYGSAAYANSPAEAPDLISAYATNGESGYVYKADLDRASMPAANPEQAVQMMRDRDAKAQALFAEALHDELDAAGVSDATIDSAAILNQVRGIPSDTALRAVGEQLAASVDSRLSPQSATDLVARATARATREMGVSIPVYLSDGKTVIGEYRSGSL
ncbi:MAG: hypothetical protein FWD75_09035 [Propionibacteriaceae bacterium]|nr:hypothetical protein [Propionibacteriaceae bacterium]